MNTNEHALGRHIHRLSCARIALAVCITTSIYGQTQPGEKLAPYYPTPQTIVRRMLDLSELKAGERMFDLGSGDGRLVIMAAQKFKADSTGVELDTDLWKQSTDKIKQLGLEASARVIHGDLLKQDYSAASVLTVYLLPNSIDEQLTPILERQLKKGTRVVSHDFEFAHWKPVKTVDIDDDGEGRSHRLFLYIR
jgi:SAM-dependent methyltransferase